MCVMFARDLADKTSIESGTLLGMCSTHRLKEGKPLFFWHILNKLLCFLYQNVLRVVDDILVADFNIYDI